MTLEIAVQAATLVGVSCGTAGVFWGVYVYRRQMNAQLFLSYTQRYSDLMRGFPADCRDLRIAIDGDLPKSSSELTSSVLEYLNLCSEEFYLWKRGYLATGVWRIWEGELVRTLQSPLLRREWEKLRAEFGSYTEFASFVDSRQRLGPETRVN